MIKIVLMLFATSLTGLNVIPVGLLSSTVVEAPQTEEIGEALSQEIDEIEIKETEIKSEAEITKDYFADAPIMVEIAMCESSLRHTNDSGGVLRGISNNKDVGIMQINERFHLEKSEIMEIDIYSLEGNLEFARYLYEKEGTRPWKASEKCWKRNNS